MRLRLGLVTVILFLGCAGGDITPPGGQGEGPSGGAGAGGSQPGSNGSSGGTVNWPAACTQAPSGAPVPCQVTAECAAPLICLGGVCQPPASSNVACDVDRPCDPGLSCIAGSCQRLPGSCRQNQDCPAGMVCQSGACVPQGAPPANCSQLPAAPDLSGLWHFDSKLHFRQALSTPLLLLLDAGQVGRDLVTGNLGDLGLPGFVSSILGPIVAAIVDSYVPPWGQDLLTALGDLHDILDDMRVKSDVTLTASCPSVYRGSEHWTRLEFQFRGVLVSRRPEDIPEIGAVHPEDFSARVLCGEVYLDKHRIRNVVGGLLRWVVDTVVNVVTCANNGPCYNSPEDAIDGLLDCHAFGQAVDDALANALPFAPSVAGLVEGACNGLKDQAINKIRMAIDQATVTFGLLSLQGQAHVGGAASLDTGVWAGSLVGSDFPGEFTAQK